MHYGNPRGKEINRQNIWRNNGLNNPNLMTVMNINIKKAQETPINISSEIHIKTHYNLIFKRQWQRFWKQLKRIFTTLSLNLFQSTRRQRIIFLFFKWGKGDISSVIYLIVWQNLDLNGDLMICIVVHYCLYHGCLKSNFSKTKQTPKALVSLNVYSSNSVPSSKKSSHQIESCYFTPRRQRS